jgi:hypothetical protein
MAPVLPLVGRKYDELPELPMIQPSVVVFVINGTPLNVGALENDASPDTINVFAVNAFVTSRFPVRKSARATDATTATNASATMYFTNLTTTS